MNTTMGTFLPYFIFPLVGYLLGSFPTGVVLSRQKYGIDVREMGSGNIGATNITRVFGWYAGFVTLVLDFVKGFLPAFLVRRFFPDLPWLMALTAIAIVLGHCFSLYLKFKGGKGVATSLGCVVVAAPWAAVFGTLAYLILLFTTRISAVGSLGGILAISVYVMIAQPSPPTLFLIIAISTIVVIRHEQNIRRLIDGWKKK